MANNIDIKTTLEYANRIKAARTRIYRDYPFYGMLISNLEFKLDTNAGTAYTDGKIIAFDPEFLKELQDYELDFVLMHEVLHVALLHCFRHVKNEDKEIANIAADMIVNSIIMKSHQFNKKYEEIAGCKVMHILPNGKEGEEVTFEEAYHLCLKAYKKLAKQNNNNMPTNSAAGSGGSSQNDKNDDSNEDQQEKESDSKGKNEDSKDKNEKGPGVPKTIDNHGKWENSAGDQMIQDLWKSRMMQAAMVMEAQKGIGSIPIFAQRVLESIKKDPLDWRNILHRFVEEEIVDYSFCPPDRRMQDNPFYLPDFNDTAEKVENIYFFIDTSGSMSDEMISSCYSEIRAAIEQFGERLKGYLGFFDAAVIPPIAFSDIQEFKRINAYGGGGTDFGCVFKYMEDVPDDKKPKSIIMLTDGFADFPKEEATNGVPVLWVICNEFVTPPYGQIARIKE